jgi:hypothetical protein
MGAEKWLVLFHFVQGKEESLVRKRNKPVATKAPLLQPKVQSARRKAGSPVPVIRLVLLDL